MFQRFHFALFKVFFEDSWNIGDPKVLVSLAKESVLDVEWFSSNLNRGSSKNEVLAEYEDGQAKYAGWGVPLAIIEDRYPVMEALPLAVYRRAVDLCLTT
ncbi:DsbA family protein [Chloroflexota bacterium]